MFIAKYYKYGDGFSSLVLRISSKGFIKNIQINECCLVIDKIETLIIWSQLEIKTVRKHVIRRNYVHYVVCITAIIAYKGEV